MKSLNVMSGISMEVLNAIDEKVANGIVRAELAVKENQDKLIDKGINVLYAVGAKMLVNTVAPDSSIANGLVNAGLVITGVALASEVKKTIDLAKSYDETKVETEIKRLGETGLSLFD
jgi:glutamyl-tRNA(gln) and/or aspartyl-tRNA(asn) amidotransferase, A subunit